MKPAHLLLSGAASLAAAQYTFTLNGTVYTVDTTTPPDAALTAGAPYIYTVNGVTYTGGPDAVHPTPPSSIVYVTGAAAARENNNAPPAPVYTVPPTPELGVTSETIFTTMKPAARARAGARAGGRDSPNAALAHAEDVEPEIHTVDDLAAPGPDATSAAFPDVFTDSAAAATGHAATGSETYAVGGVNATATAAPSAATGPGGVVEVSTVPSVAGQSPTTTISATASASATSVGKSGAGAGGAEIVDGFFPGGVLVALGATFFYLL